MKEQKQYTLSERIAYYETLENYLARQLYRVSKRLNELKSDAYQDWNERLPEQIREAQKRDKNQGQ